MKKLHFIGDERFVPGLKLLQEQLAFTLDTAGYEVVCSQGGEGICVDITQGRATVTYQKDTLFFRAFSLAAQYAGGEDRKITVSCQFNRYGSMQNCSNRVLSVDMMKEFIRQSALMGYNYVEVYTETTYEIPGEPYFGHMHGRYSQAELQELVAYGEMFCVELIPSIQTIGHLASLFKSGPYGHLHDIQATILADYEPTYELIEKMLRSLRQCYKTQRINLGMDEAYFMGKGRYHWFVDDSCPDPSMMFIRHLKRVLEIAKKAGFSEPAIWFDNLFEINYKGYIDPPEWLWTDFRQEIVEAFPEVRLIYWNYVVRDVENFKRWVGYVKQLGKNVSFASMVHGYTSLAPENYITAQLVETAKAGCAAMGIDDIMLTWWGHRISPMTLMAGYYHYIENCGESSGYDFNDRCCFLFGYTYDELCQLDLPNKIEANNSSTGMAEGNNPAYYILANDPLLGLLDSHIPQDADTTYARYSEILGKLAKRKTPLNYLFAFEQVLCEALSITCHLSRDIKSAYDKGDKTAVLMLAGEKIPQVIAAQEKLLESYRSYWLRFNKSFGWETYERQLGGNLIRLQSVACTLRDYAQGKLSHIPELEQERLPFNMHKDGRVIGMSNWVGASTID